MKLFAKTKVSVFEKDWVGFRAFVRASVIPTVNRGSVFVIVGGYGTRSNAKTHSSWKSFSLTILGYMCVQKPSNGSFCRKYWKSPLFPALVSTPPLFHVISLMSSSFSSLWLMSSSLLSSSLSLFHPVISTPPFLIVFATCSILASFFHRYSIGTGGN